MKLEEHQSVDEAEEKAEAYLGNLAALKTLQFSFADTPTFVRGSK